MGQKTHPQGFRLVTTQKHLSDWYSSKFCYSSLIEEDYLLRKKVTDFFEDFLTISKVEISRIQQEAETQEYIHITISSLFPRVKHLSRKVGKTLILATKNLTPKRLVLLNNLKAKEKGNEKGKEKRKEKGKERGKERGKEKEQMEGKTKGKRKKIKVNFKQFTILLLKRTIRSFIRFFQLKTKKNYSISVCFIRNPFEDATLIAKFIAKQLEKRTPFRRIVKQTIKKVKRTKMRGIKIQLSGRLNGAEIARSEWKRYGQVPLHTLDTYIDYTHYSAYTVYGIIGIKIWLCKFHPFFE